MDVSVTLDLLQHTMGNTIITWGNKNTQLHNESQMQGCKCAQTREGGWNHVLEGDVEAWDGGEKWGPAIVNARS